MCSEQYFSWVKKNLRVDVCTILFGTMYLSKKFSNSIHLYLCQWDIKVRLNLPCFVNADLHQSQFVLLGSVLA